MTQNPDVLKIRVIMGNIEFEPAKIPIRIVMTTLSGKELRPINIESTVFIFLNIFNNFYTIFQSYDNVYRF